MWRQGLLVTAAVVWAIGCSTRLAPSRSAVPTTPPASGALPATTERAVALSADNTRVTFIGTAGSTSHEGTFDRLTGQWELPTDDPKDSRLGVQIETDSLRTRIGLLTAHLKRADFLDAKQFPTATFRSTRIEPAPGPDGATHRVSGEFTIHGVTQALTFPAKVQVGPEAVTFEATFPVGQVAFGMPAAAEKTTNDVPVTVVVNARRK